MRTYQQRMPSNQSLASGAGRMSAQHNPLQRAINSGARMQAQRQQASLVSTSTVAQAKFGFKSLAKPFKTKTAADIATNSPGILTTLPPNLMSPVSTGLSYQEKLGSGISTASKAANANMSIASNAVSLGGDIVGAALSGIAIKQNAANFNSTNYIDQREARSEVKSAVGNLINQVPDAGGQLSSVIGGAAATGSQLATTAGAAGAFITAPVGVFNSVRASVSAWRAGRYRKNLRALATDNSPLKASANFAADQMGKRERRQATTAVGAAIGVGGAIALGVGIVAGAALMATPVGWGLAAAAGAVALGVGAYKAYNYVKKRRAGSLGNERNQHATAIIEALESSDGATKQQAVDLLKARGIDASKLVLGDATEKAKNVAFLAKKLKSW